MRKLLALAVATLGAALVVMPFDADARGGRSSSARPYYGGGKHTSSHGGAYNGGQGSSHRGGTYSNPRSRDRYGRHK